MAGVAEPESTNTRIAKQRQPAQALVTGSDKATASALPLPNPPLRLRRKGGSKAHHPFGAATPISFNNRGAFSTFSISHNM